MTQITRHYTSECKTPGCNHPVVFHQDSYQKMQEQGVNPPAYCEVCRKSRRQAHNLFVSYTRPRLDRSQARTSLEVRERLYYNRDGQHRFNSEKFGVNIDHMKAVFQWFAQPQARCGVVRGQTGSGKSTAFVYYLLNPPEGYPHDFFTRDGQIWVTQPRIVAAEGISQYIGNILLGDTFGKGGLIGTRTSQSKDYDPHNLVVMATDGSVLNILLEGELDTVSMILIDEVHQRSTTIDLIMGLTLYWMPAFPKLRLMVASATIDPEVYQEYMGKKQTAIFDIPGKQPVGKDIIWPQVWNSDSQVLLNYSDVRSITSQLTEVSIAKTLWVLDMIRSKQVAYGDILVFFPGKREISDFLESLQKNLPSNMKITLHELHAQVSEKQKAVLEEVAPKGVLRIIASTNVAEASVTIEGLRHVIDCGLEKQDEWKIEEERTVILPILTGRSNCKQRWGRVGRTTHGWVYPLYSEEQFKTLFQEYLQPSIERSSLIEARLKLAQSGIPLESIRLLGDPDSDELKRSGDVLTSQNFIDRSGFITAQGQNALESDIQSAIDIMLTKSEELGCFMEMVSIIPFMRNGGFRNFFDWNNSWLLETKYLINQLYQVLFSECKDDIDVWKKIICLYHDCPDYLSTWFIDMNSLEQAMTETYEIIKQWSLGKKEKHIVDLVRPLESDKYDVVRNIISSLEIDSVARIFSEEQYQYSAWMNMRSQSMSVCIHECGQDWAFKDQIFSSRDSEILLRESGEVQTVDISVSTEADTQNHTVMIGSFVHDGGFSLDTVQGSTIRLKEGDSVKGQLDKHELICERDSLYIWSIDSDTKIVSSHSDLGISYFCDISQLKDVQGRYEGELFGRPIISLLEYIPSLPKQVIGWLRYYDEERYVVQSKDFPMVYLEGKSEYLPETVVLEKDDLYFVQVRTESRGEFLTSSTYSDYLHKMRKSDFLGLDREVLYADYRFVKRYRAQKMISHTLYQNIRHTLYGMVWTDLTVDEKNRGGYVFSFEVANLPFRGFLPFGKVGKRRFIPVQGKVSLVIEEFDVFRQSVVFGLVSDTVLYSQYLSRKEEIVQVIADRYIEGVGQFFHLCNGICGFVPQRTIGFARTQGVSMYARIVNVDIARQRITLTLT